MPGFLVRNWRLKLLALVLAIVAWVGVVYAANPPGQKTVLVAVPQPPAVSLPGNYVLTSPIPDITVSVAGTQDHLASFNAGYLRVSVDYSVVSRVGNHVPATVSLPVHLSNDDRNVQVVNPPTNVQADVDRNRTATAAVTALISNDPGPGYTADTPVVTPNVVNLTGPGHELLGATVKTQAIDLKYQTADFTETLPVYTYGANGEKLSNVSADPPSVTVRITISPVHTIRTSSLLLGPFRGMPAGYAVSSISYTPMTVTLAGSQNVLNQVSLGSVTTAVIDLGDRTGTNTYIVTIPSPAAGVTVSPATVTVTVTLVPIPTPTPAPTPTPTPTPPPASP
jgi:YbbR domain-containing protein